jgi:hypothetical protein
LLECVVVRPATSQLRHEVIVPTVRNITGPYHFFFYRFDCNESVHVHVRRERSLCKFWRAPVVLASKNGFQRGIELKP